MTRNQQRALSLARPLLSDRVEVLDVSDTEWALLMLAAGVCDVRLAPMSLAYRVLDQYDRQQGLFAVEIPDAELFEPQPELNAPPEIIIGQVGVTYAIG